MSGCTQEHLRSLFKGRLRNRSNVIIIDAMPEDRYHLIIARHPVAQDAQVMVVNVGAVKLNHL